MIGHADRHLDWEGCFNARDLGGLPSSMGGATRGGAVARADELSGLTSAGWSALLAHGVRTVIDLRNPDERRADAAPRPEAVATVEIALDGAEDRDFWEEWAHGPQFATPLYYAAHLCRFPARSAAVLAAIARAGPGGVVFHCVGGRDRSGQIAMLLLHLVSVPVEEIAADYAISAERLPARYAALGEPDQGPEIDAFLAERGTSAPELIADTLSSLEIADLLRAGGLTDADVALLRERLLER